MLLYLAFVFSIVDFSMMLWMHHTLNHRVRSAARYGIVNTFDAAKIQNMVLYGTPAAGADAYLGLTPSNVEVRHDDAGLPTERLTVRAHDFEYPTFTYLVAGRHVGRWKDVTMSLTMEKK